METSNGEAVRCTIATFYQVACSVSRLREAAQPMSLKTISITGLLAAAFAALAAQPAAAELRGFDVSRQAGLYDVAHTWSAEVADYDNDGRDDVFVNRHYEPAGGTLHRNVGGRFERVDTGPESFPKTDRHDCAWGDVDRNGRQDLYCTVGGERGSGLRPNELWLQQPSGQFVNRAADYGVEDRRGRGRDTTFIDVNRDGFLDLYVGNKFPRTDGKQSKNKLFINQGGQSFRPAPEYGLNKQVGGKTIQAVDYNEDGFKDLLVCGERRLYLFRNAGGRAFSDVTRQLGIADPCEAALFANIDGRGRPDLVRLAEGRVTATPQRGARFRKPSLSREVRGGEYLAAGRVNRDRLDDLYVVQSGPIDKDRPDLMLLNRRGGTDFDRLDMAQTTRGKGDYVAAIDHDGDGRDEFIVMNGHLKAEGPIRLIAFR
ncbi:MAG: VCBS repeat-containing protein [Thermoleophilaceae bacterium]|nr:VCBS repeat-containing protein [Thermoleophilaceae bacterium]